MTGLFLSITALSVPQIANAETATLETLIGNNCVGDQLTTIDHSAWVQNNRLILAPNDTSSNSTAYLKTPITFTDDLALDFGVRFNQQSQAYQTGESLAIGLVPADQLQKFNQSQPGVDGFAGLANVFGFKLIVAPQTTAIPNTTVVDNFQPFGTFFSSGNDGVIQTLADQNQILDNTIFNNRFENLSLSYDDAQHILRIAYHGQVWQYTLNQATTWQQPMYLVFSAATGHATASNQVSPPDPLQDHAATAITTYYAKTQVDNTQQPTGDPNPSYVANTMPKSATDQTPNQTMTHHVIIDYVYQGQSLRKEILTGQSGDIINYTTAAMMTRLQAYQIVGSDWPGHFKIPDSSQEAWYFKVDLSKKQQQQFFSQVPVTPDNGIPPSESSVTDSWHDNSVPAEMPSVVNEVNQNNGPIEKPVTINQPVPDHVPQKLNKHQYESTVTTKHVKPQVNVVPYIEKIRQDMFRQQLMTSVKKPSPFNTTVSDFTKVLSVLANYSTFSSR